jgi:hypothetical protein
VTNPISRLQAEIDAAFGPGFAETNPALVAAVMSSAASDYAAHLLADALRRSAEAIADALAAVDLPDAIIRPAELCR